MSLVYGHTLGLLSSPLPSISPSHVSRDAGHGGDPTDKFQWSGLSPHWEGQGGHLTLIHGKEAKW